MADTGSEPVRGDPLAEFREMFREQSERQGRLRHVQQFLTSPLFLDLREQPMVVSDPPEAVEERKHDLDYRIKVLQSLLELLTEERAALERTFSAETVAELDAEEAAAAEAARDRDAPDVAEAAGTTADETAGKTGQETGRKTGGTAARQAGRKAGKGAGKRAGARTASGTGPEAVPGTGAPPDPAPDPAPGQDRDQR